MQRVSAAVLFCSFMLSVKGGTNFTEGAVEPQSKAPVTPPLLKSSFHLYHEGNVFEETCPVLPFRPQSLHRCGYNSSDPLVMIIHGWTMNGVMEQWLFNLASALKVRLGRVNVLISDWRNLALQPYPVAAKNSRQVGQDVATLLKWLQDAVQLSMDDVHLIGYSLGAHVAGFAGSHFRGLKKVGRITGLDPAGPHFEGMPAFDRLSPDDAQFVDAIHTFTKSNLMPGVGIKQRVAHVDFYPNGGTFQPGCKMMDIYSNIFQYGLEGVPKTIKCSHERAIHLFMESLVNVSGSPLGYRCLNAEAFSRGLCLDCKHKRCNMLGFDVRREHAGTNAKGLYLRTGPETPYKVFHYQIKVLLTNLTVTVDEASVSVTINGTQGLAEDKPLILYQESGGRKAFLSLLTTEVELGELSTVTLVWEGELAWSIWMRRFSNIMSWSPSQQELSASKIRIKSGETQQKWWFCSVSDDQQKFRLCRSLQKHRTSSSST